MATDEQMRLLSQALAGSLAEALERQRQLGLRYVESATDAAMAAALAELVPLDAASMNRSERPGAAAARVQPTSHVSSDAGVAEGASTGDGTPGDEGSVALPWAQRRRPRAGGLSALAVEVATCVACPRGSSAATRAPFVSKRRRSAKAIVVLACAEGDGSGWGAWFEPPDADLVERMLSAIGLQLEDVHVLPLVRCSPEPRSALRDEDVAACSVWLRRELSELPAAPMLVISREAASQLPREGRGGSAQLMGAWHTSFGRAWVAIEHPRTIMEDPERVGERKRQAWQVLRMVAERLPSASASGGGGS